jgi:hypothetical protein
MAGAATTKTDRQLEDKMLAVAGDSERVFVLGKARAFKRSWIELAEALSQVVERGSWERWGYSSFDSYCKKELHLSPSTSAKLLGSFRFLKTQAPKIIERSRDSESAPIPDLKAVEFVAKAEERGAADESTMAEIRRAAFEEGAHAPLLSRRFKSVAFPVSDMERESKLLQQLSATSKKLAAMLADPDLPIDHAIAAKVEESLGELLSAVDAKMN